MEIAVNMDDVQVEGQMVQRPNYISRKRWLEFWESIQYLEARSIECLHPNCPFGH